MVSTFLDSGSRSAITKEDAGISMSFVRCLYSHIVKDVNPSNHTWNSLDQDVQEWKRSKPECICSASETHEGSLVEWERQLISKRAARDVAFKIHEELLEARENLKVSTEMIIIMFRNNIDFIDIYSPLGNCWNPRREKQSEEEEN